MGRIRTMIAPVSATANINDPRVWTQMGGGVSMSGLGRSTMSGESVSPERALTLPAYLAAIQNKSEDIAAQPWHVFRPKANGRGKEKAEDAAAYALLHDEWNPYMSSALGVELLLSWAWGWGLGLAEREVVDGETVALWPIHPSRVTARWVKGEPIYYIRNEKDAFNPLPLRSKDVFVVFGLGADGLCGYSIASMIAEAIGVGLAAQKYGAAVFGNDTALGVIFTTDEEMSEEAYQRMRVSIAEQRSGASQAFKPFIAEGAKVDRLGIPPKDAQMIETQQFTVGQVGRVMRMPLHMIGEREPFASVEQLGIEYARFSLNPWCVRLQKEAKRKILRGKRGWSNRIMLQGLMAGDYTGRTGGYRTMISTGAMTPNEARELEDAEPSDDPSADLLWMQGAMQPIRKLAEPAPDPAQAPVAPPAPSEPTAPAEEDPTAKVGAARPVFVDAARRLVVRQDKSSARARTKHASDGPAFTRWATTFFDSEKAKIVDAFGPVCESVGADPGAWLMESAHDLARAMGQEVVWAFSNEAEQPPAETRVQVLAATMMRQAVRAAEEMR